MGLYTRDQVLDAIADGVFEIYRVLPAAWILVEFIETNRGKTMNIMTVVGSREDWERGWQGVEKIARDNNCNMIFSVGHPGWKRFMEQHGYKTEPMLKMYKEISK